jgi:hypothetical protein
MVRTIDARGRSPMCPPAHTVPARGRWRWRIGPPGGAELVPHRLLVALIENRRVDGKVRQAHVAELGAIDGHLLSAFYAALEPATVNAILSGAEGMEAWYRASVRARVAPVLAALQRHPSKAREPDR